MLPDSVTIPVTFLVTKKVTEIYPDCIYCMLAIE
jgi:hypothetical protein